MDRFESAAQDAQRVIREYLPDMNPRELTGDLLKRELGTLPGHLFINEHEGSVYQTFEGEINEMIEQVRAVLPHLIAMHSIKTNAGMQEGISCREVTRASLELRKEKDHKPLREDLLILQRTIVAHIICSMLAKKRTGDGTRKTTEPVALLREQAGTKKLRAITTPKTEPVTKKTPATVALTEEPPTTPQEKPPIKSGRKAARKKKRQDKRSTTNKAKGPKPFEWARLDEILAECIAGTRPLDDQLKSAISRITSADAIQIPRAQSNKLKEQFSKLGIPIPRILSSHMRL